MQDFIHLHVASSLSMRYGTHRPSDLVAHAAQMGQRALALTDRDNVAGAVSFVQACASAGISPILGVDLALLTPQPYKPTPAHGGKWLRVERPRVTLLAHDKKSWAGLCKAISQAHATEGDPEIDRAFVMQIAGEHGLRVLLGPNSDVGQDIARRRPDRALEQLRAWQTHGVSPYIEIATHGQNPDDDGQSGNALSDRFAARMLQWAIVHRTPAVLTNMVRYREQNSAKVADVLDAARWQVPLLRRKFERTDQAFLADGAHMHSVAARIAAMVGDPRDIARTLIQHTLDLGERSIIDPKNDLGLGSVFVPELSQVLPEETRSANSILRQWCDEGFARYLIREPHNRAIAHERLESELDVVMRMGLASYIITVADVVSMIKQMGIRVAARGSGAGSFINRVLGISGVDPIEHNLLMERFISTLRPGLPDIDVDVESARRLEVYDAIFDKFGPERTACVSMQETYRVRNAIRDVGGALGMPPGEIHTVAKSFPHIKAKHVRGALAELPELRRTGLATLAQRGDLDEFLDLVEALDGLPRHMAMHPCGIILSDQSLLERTPVQPSGQGYPMTQFDKDDVEHMGLLKLDVLGVRMQSALAYAVQEVKRVQNVDLDLEAIPRDDPETFQLIQSTRTLGCFQIESPGQRELVGKFAPEKFNDLIVDISLFRPGPVKSDMISPFLRARQGWAVADYIHPDLREALEETAGVVVYHEQVMRVVSTLTGCTLEHADLIRRRLGDINQLDEIREWFYKATARRKYSLAVIENAWEVLRAFASFGFCKAHGAAFALPTYQSAWFKAHYPAEFLAGVLTHDPGMYPKRLILDDARGFDVPILGLDVNASKETFVVERVAEGKQGIRIALAQVKGISDAEIESILAEQPFYSLPDFINRARVSQPITERLILAGGFDALHGTHASRRDLLYHFAEFAKQFGLSKRPTSTQIALGADFQSWIPKPAGLKALTLSDKVKYEIEILGLDVSAHVVSFYEPMLRELNAVPARDLLQVRSQGRVFVAGAKVATQTPPIRTGRRVAFVTLDDSTGPIDAAFFEEVQDRYAPTIFHSWLLLVQGNVRRTGPRGVSIQSEGCWELGTIYQVWREGGVDAVHEFISARPYDDEEPVALTRTWEHASGFQVSPYADVAPAGQGVGA
jgi:error-prone DNA polymerase